MGSRGCSGGFAAPFGGGARARATVLDTPSIAGGTGASAAALSAAAAAGGGEVARCKSAPANCCMKGWTVKFSMVGGLSQVRRANAWSLLIAAGCHEGQMLLAGASGTVIAGKQ